MEHIDRYLSAPPPGYALLIGGLWGVGKSHFWRFYSETLSRFGLHPITISVAGLSTLEELDRALLQASISRIGNQPIREASSAIGRALLRTINIDPDDIRLKADLISGKTVVCIDDLERFSGRSLSVLFGFIMDLIDKAGVHCVLVADDTKAIEKFPDFAETKERIVGKTVRIVPDVRGFVRQSIMEMPDGTPRTILLAELDYVADLVESASIVNLRTVRYLVTEVESVLRFVVPTSLAGANFRKLIEATAFWATSTSKDAQAIDSVVLAFKSADLGIAFAISDSNRELDQEEAGLMKVRRMLEKFGLEDRALSWPRSLEFVNLVEGRAVNYAQIAEDFGLTAQEPEVDPLAELGRFRDLPDERIQLLAAGLRQEIVDGRMRSLGRLFETFRVLLYLSRIDVLPDTPDELIVAVVAAIEAMNPEEIEGETEFLFGPYNDYERRIIAEIKRISKEAERIAETRRHRQLVQDVLGGVSSEESRLEEIFKNESPAEFLAQLRVAPGGGVRSVASLFRSRMRIANAHQFLAGDREFSVELARLIRAGVAVQRPMPVRDAILLELASILESFVQFLDAGERE